ncbi:hypothetical protein, partial [Deinococcus aerophilus]|uniref:Spore coat protein U domain-containing protein n=1 Tax=Deinococcus aerophilus TaxID=522488 RepID=A0ABQ2H1B5_9DEIO
MKKIVVAALSAALMSTAFAGTASTSVTINANVLSSCTFDSNATQAASFTYDAINGTSDAMAGSAVLYCNAGTRMGTITPDMGPIMLKSMSKDAVLNAEYTLSFVANPGMGMGSYLGADKYEYTLSALAPAGQWGAPTADDYTYIVDIEVNF